MGPTNPAPRPLPSVAPRHCAEVTIPTTGGELHRGRPGRLAASLAA